MKFIPLVFLLLLSVSGFSQKKDLSLEMSVLGYNQAEKTGFRPQNLMSAQWIPGTKTYSYLLQRMAGVVVVANGVNDTITLAEVSEAAGLKMRYIPFVEWTNSNSFIFSNKNSYYTYHVKEKKSELLLEYKEGAENRDLHAASKQCAITIKQNLYIATAEEKMGVVTHFSNKEFVAGKAIARFEFGISKGTFWSSDGEKLAFYQKDESNVHDYPLLDMTKTPGELKTVKYPMAGQKSELAKAGVYNTKSKKITYLETNHGDLGKEHYLTNLSWDPTNQFIFLAEVNRDQNHMKLNKYDASTGKLIATLFEEKNDRYVEPEYPPMFIPGLNDEFLWFSERDGFMNLFHYNTDGELLNKVTNVDWVVQSILGYDQKGRTVFVSGTGEDPRQKHAYSFDIKTGKMRMLTTEPGTHHLQLSDDGTKILDNYSSLTVPRRIDIIDIKSARAKNIFKADNPLVDYKAGKTQFVTLKSQDSSKLFGRLITPSDFDKSKKYPVLVYVYGGPHAQMVTNSWGAGASLWMNWLAEQGYIVFTVDGRGSSNRGFEFESGIHRQLGKLEIEDQLTGVEYLKTLKFVDTDRMAIHGWSFGGFMTTTMMLKQPDVFKCGVAGGPVIDWKWYEIMYGERYMDTPEQNKEGYAEASLLDKVTGLKGDLLMIHGTVDDVVVMQHNLAFVKACVDNGVQIDFFPYPNHPHNVRGKDRVHLMTKVLNYVIESLEE